MFENMTLKQKFITLETVSFVMFLAMSCFALMMLKGAVTDQGASINRLKLDIVVMENVSTMDIATLKQAKLAKDVWLRGANPDKLKQYRGEFLSERARFQQSWNEAKQSLQKLAVGHEREFADYLARLDTVQQLHVAMSEKYLSQIDAYRGDATESDARVAGIDRAVIDAVKGLREDFVVFTDKKAVEKLQMAEEDYAQRRTIIAVWVLVSLGLSFALASLIIRQIMRQLGGDPREVVNVVNVMAEGDFSRMPGHQPPAGSLLANAYHMQSRLRDMIAGVKRQANQVGDMAHSLAASATQIAQNVNQESDAVSGMAAAIEELSVSTTHISDQGANAKQIANSSRDNAREGARVVNMTVSGLLEIAQEIESASSEVSRLGHDASRISDVVKVIKEIADQTNLLALNAAIEAARAGEMGRGFAVVADEVRKLAERTAGATSEISEMSGKIGEVANHALTGMDRVVQTTRQGVGNAETAQNSISHIQTNFSEVAGVIDDIAVALEEQNCAAAELARSTERVSQMSEENAGAARNLLGLARDLEGKAGEVRQAVEVFHI